jgi:hypothetical protein
VLALHARAVSDAWGLANKAQHNDNNYQKDNGNGCCD